MEKELIGLISGGLVVASVIPYAIRVYQAKIKPNITTWFLWTILGLALLLTYRSSGAESNVWPAVFGFTNPLLITLLAIKSKRKWEKLNRVEIVCLIAGLVAIAMWFWLNHSKNLVQYALYVAILADACAAIPTIVFVWHCPEDDRPFAWGLFGIGYGLAVFAISEHTFANYILPLYMFAGASTIATILAAYRVKSKLPLREWL